MKKFHLIVAIVGLAVASGAAYWYQRRPAPDSQGPTAARTAAAPVPAQGAQGGPPVVEVGKVEAVTLYDDAQAVGSLRARQSVVVRPEVSGRISKLGFVDGARVKRGQLLVQLDDTLQAAQLQQAEAQASIARTNLQRGRELLSQGFVSQSAVDQNAAALQVAEAQVALARAQLQRMKIVAPFDGVTGIRTAYVGDYVKDGGDIVTLEDISALYVDFRLAERYIARLKPDQSVEVALDALPGRSFEARIEAIDSLLDANGRSLLVRARLDNAQHALRSGMFARVRVIFDVREKALVVPEEALVPMAGKRFLVKLVDRPGVGKVGQRIEARTGLRLPGKVEILEGVAAGDMVVTAGQQALLRGDPRPVKVVDVGRAPRAPAEGGGAGAPGAGPEAAPNVPGAPAGASAPPRAVAPA